MARWVSGNSAGRICFFDCSGGSCVVQPYVSPRSKNGGSNSSTISYYQKLLRSPCSCLTFSGGWGGYDESEVTLGTSEGGVFAIPSQWPSPAAAAAATSSVSSDANYFDFPQTEREAEVLRCASLPYCVLLVQMLGVHTPELRRLMQYSEAAATTAAVMDCAYPGICDSLCCRSHTSSRGSTSSCSCHTRSGELFGTDRQLLAVDKGGNGIVLDWCTSTSSSSSIYESPELRSFSLREPLCCCSSNSLLVQQLAVASATAASFLSVYDIEANCSCFYAHVPPAVAAAQTIVRCNSSTGTRSTQLASGSAACEGGPVTARAGSTSATVASSSTRFPVYAEVASPWPRRGTELETAAAAVNSRNSSKLQQQVCTSVSWLPRLGPSLLCGVTADALLLLYDTRASSFPVYIASTGTARGPTDPPRDSSGGRRDAAQGAGGPRPMVFVGTQPGLVAAQDDMEAAVLPCCCCCCSCSACKGDQKEQQGQQQQQQQQKQQHQVTQQDLSHHSLFRGHRGRLVLKPHATGRRKRTSSSGGSRLPLLCSKLQQRITKDFEDLAEAHRGQSVPPKPQVHSSASSAAAPEASPAEKAADGTADSKVTSSNNSDRTSNRLQPDQPRGRESWGPALVALSSSSDSPLTSFPAGPLAADAAELQKQQQHTGLPPEVVGWLATACYALVASSLSLLLTQKHIVRHRLLHHAQQQLLLLLRSSCLPPVALQPAASSAAIGKNRTTTSSEGCYSGDPPAAAATPLSTRPPKKARLRAGAAAAGKTVTTSTAAGTESTAAAAAPLTKQQDVLQQFATRVVQLLRVLEPAEGNGNAKDLREQQQQQVQQHLPLLLERQRQNVLRLLEYCAAFSFCFSQSFLGTEGHPLESSNSLSQPAATAAAAQAMQQSNLPALLLQQATKEVLHRFKKLAAAGGGSAGAAFASAACQFVGSLRMGFGFAAQRSHLLFNVLLCWQQQQQQQQEEIPLSRPLLKLADSAQGEDDNCSSKIQQQQHPITAPVAIPEVYIQRNCICRLPIPDPLYFSIAKQQSSRSKRSSSTKETHHSRGNSSNEPAVGTAQLICCDIAGEVSVLRVTVRHFGTQRRKQQYIHRTAAAAGGVKPKGSSALQQQKGDVLAKCHIWFPELPALLSEDEACAAGADGEGEISASSSALQGDDIPSFGKACSCRCCINSYSVRLEMNFLAPRSSTSSSNLSVHSNGSYLLIASRDPYFALYGVNPNLPPYRSCSRSRVPPLLGLALPPVNAAPLQQQQHGAAEVTQPLLLSAAPLLPSVPLATSIPPYLVAPPIPPTQVSLRRRFQQQVLQQQQAAATAAPASLGGAAWDTAIEFSDWLSEPEEPEWQHSDEE